MKILRTPTTAKAWLIAQGVSVKAFADTHGLDAPTTYQVLSGKKVGRRGKAYASAVALGIKDKHRGRIMDDDLNEVTADALELLMLNQNALGACIEEISLWLRGEGADAAHSNITSALQTLDQNAENIAAAIKSLRREGA